MYEPTLIKTIKDLRENLKPIEYNGMTAIHNSLEVDTKLLQELLKVYEKNSDLQLTSVSKDKSKWSDIDYVKDYIRSKGYTPKTDLDNLAHMLINHYEGMLESENFECYAIPDNREFPNDLMIHIEDLDVYVSDSGGLEEFDYYS